MSRRPLWLALLALMNANPTALAPRRATFDPEFAWQIVARRPLLYADGAAPVLDRPAHVRAASGITWVGERLLAIQDDANFLALIDPATGRAEGVPLPPGPNGRRLFGDDRGTKQFKLDLEACLAVDVGDTLTLFAFGSGSKPLRERIVSASFVAGRPNGEPQVIDARSFYRVLHDAHHFSGSELNLEGVALEGDTLYLFQRGNGARRDDRLPVNAVATLPFASLRDYLAHAGDRAHTPTLATITAYELGAIDGVPLSFTDATRGRSGTLLFLASAEASSDAVSDGGVHGTRVGEIDGDAVRTGPLLDEQGVPSRLKAEGIALDPRDSGRVYLVVDMDDHAIPSELLEVRLLR